MAILYNEWQKKVLEILFRTDGSPINFDETIRKINPKIGIDKSQFFFEDLVSKGFAAGKRTHARLTITGREYLYENRMEFDLDPKPIIVQPKEGLSGKQRKEKKKIEIELSDEIKQEVPESTQDFLKEDLKERYIEDLESQKDRTDQVLKHSLSNSKDDAELLKRGYRCQGLIGYTSDIDQSAFKIIRSWSLDDEDEVLIRIAKDWGEKFETHHQEILGFVWNSIEKNLIKLQEYVIDSPSYPTIICTNPKGNELKKLGYTLSNSSPDHYLSQKKSENGIPLYVYSNHPDIFLFEPLQEIKSHEYDHESDIIADVIAKEDELGRRGLMEIVYSKVNKLWGKLADDQSFTILLNGEWGSGKSSMLFYFKEILENSNWSVVEYNAWRNQRFPDPWWIFVNKVSKEVPRRSEKGENSRSHRSWKWRMQYSNIYIGSFITSILLIVGFKYDVFGDEKNLAFIASVLALIGTLWVSVNGAVKNIFKKKTLSEVQAKNANDPLEPYKERFDNVVKNKKIAIFIDDLDRCEVEPTVQLLEGIQTLFKNTKVLYVVAADGHWVSNCFDDKYQKFEKLVSAGQTIGNQFLQKTFQLIVDVPKLSKNQQKKLVLKHLGRLDESALSEPEIEVSDQEISESQTLESLSGMTATAGTESRKKAAERAEEIIEEQKEHYIEKLLKDDTLPANPRQIIRLINLFTLKIQELLITGNLEEVTQENVLRYVLFSTEYPEYNYAIRTLSKEDIDEQFPNLNKTLGDLTEEMIKTYL